MSTSVCAVFRFEISDLDRFRHLKCGGAVRAVFPVPVEEVEDALSAPMIEVCCGEHSFVRFVRRHQLITAPYLGRQLVVFEFTGERR